MNKLKNALVIDTDPTFRQYVTLRLEILGYKVWEAETPHQIRQAVKEGQADLVVTDYAVPGLEGAQLLQALEPSKRPVFLLTDSVTGNPETFQEQTQVRAVISKKKRWEFFKHLETIIPSNAAPEESAPETETPDEKHILLIEDSPTIRNFVRRILEREMPGSVIREAQDGREAISEMAQKKVDFIITDLQMPGMDGHTFLRKVRGNNILRQKPVLVFSSSDASGIKEEFRDDTCLEFLPKPASPEEIVSAIRRLWDCQANPLQKFKR